MIFVKRVFFAILILGTVIGLLLRDFLPKKPVAAKIVKITSRNLKFQVLTKAKTVEEVLAEQKFESANSDRSVIHGMTIEVTRPVKVKLIDGGSEQEVVTEAPTVGDLLFEQKIALAPTDRIRPEAESYLAEHMKIIIDRIVDLEVSEINDIPFEIKLAHDPEILYGREKIIEAGHFGEKEEKFLITYKNGVEIKRELLSRKILEKPLAEIRRFGTKIEIEENTEGKASWYAYKKCMCAAHPFYDKGRYVLVTSLNSGKSIILRINDRGPVLEKHPDRIIDLDSVAFKELAPLRAGTIGVRVELLK